MSGLNAKIINLNRRTDRWKQAEAELSPHFELERIPAVEMSPGWMGLNATMSALFADADGDLLVFEDDATFNGTIERLNACISDLPDEWDMLLFGANIKGRVERVTPNLVRCYGAWTTHAVLYSANFCRKMRNLTMHTVIDEYFRTQIHPMGNTYICTPFLSIQRPSVSDLEGVHKDYADVFAESERKAMSV